MAANVISLSFKNNLEEINMYNFLKTKSSPSAYIKELIKNDIGDNNIYTKNDKKNTKNNNEVKEESTIVNSITNVGSLCR